MANPNQAPKQNLVRRYIIGKLFPACGKDPVPLNELALARKFGVNRLTVRKACADLVEDHSLITLPGRRGLFINPNYTMMHGISRFIGIIGSVKDFTIIENINFRILSSFDYAMGDEEGDYHFLSICAKEPREMVDEICSYPLNGLLWLMPNSELLPVFEKVVETGLPAVAVAPAFLDDWTPPRFNAVLYDNEFTGRRRARAVLQAGVTHPGYFASNKGDTFSGFCKEFRDSGLSDREDFFRLIGGSSYSEIRRWIRRKEIDSLVMDGRIMTSFCNFYHAVPELKQILLFIDYAPCTRLLQSIDPNLRVCFFRHFLQRGEQAGKCAAAMMTRLIQSRCRQIENTVVCDSLDEGVF